MLSECLRRTDMDGVFLAVTRWYGGAPLLKLVLPARSDSAGRAGGTERRREGSAFTWARAGRDDTGEGASERAGGGESWGARPILEMLLLRLFLSQLRAAVTASID